MTAAPPGPRDPVDSREPVDPRAPLDPLELAELICAELDPVLTRYGFAPGQTGVGSTVGVVFCASLADFRERFPHLGPEIEGPLGGCVDLNVDLNVDAGLGADGRLQSISLEGIPLETLLDREGPEFAGGAAAIAELPTPEAVARLRDALESLFARHAAA